MRIIDADALEAQWTIANPEAYSTDAAEVLNTIRKAPTLYRYVDFGDKIEELKRRIPEALYDKVSEKLLEDQYCSVWIHCLDCVNEMADAWKEINGGELIWVPGHYEHNPKNKSIDSMNFSFDPTSLYQA